MFFVNGSTSERSWLVNPSLTTIMKTIKCEGNIHITHQSAVSSKPKALSKFSEMVNAHFKIVKNIIFTLGKGTEDSKIEGFEDEMLDDETEPDSLDVWVNESRLVEQVSMSNLNPAVGSASHISRTSDETPEEWFQTAR